MQTAGEAHEINDGADVGRIEAAASHARVACGVDEVGAGAVGEGFGDSLGVAVVEQGLVAGLGKAGVLLVERTLEAVGVGLEGEGTGEQVAMFLQCLGVAGRDLLHGGEIFLDAALLEAGFGKIL